MEVQVGTTIVLIDESDRKKKVFHLVPGNLADAGRGRISPASPLAAELIGRKGGEVIHLELPKGAVVYRIHSVSETHEPAA